MSMSFEYDTPCLGQKNDANLLSAYVLLLQGFATASKSWTHTQQCFLHLFTSAPSASFSTNALSI